AQIGHGSGQNRRDQQPSQSAWKLGRDKGGEDAVHAAERRGGRKVPVEGEQHHPDHQEQSQLKQDEKTARKQGRLALSLVASRQQALHDQLVGAVAGAGEERAAHESRPEKIRIVPVEVKVEKRELVARALSQPGNFPPAAGDGLDRQNERQDSAQKVEELL